MELYDHGEVLLVTLFKKSIYSQHSPDLQILDNDQLDTHLLDFTIRLL